jgi:ABC-2 type transport system permease protein
MKKEIVYYFKIWLMYSRNSFVVWFGRRSLLIIFLSGKLIRYIFYFGFLYFLVINTEGVLDYTPFEVLFFTSTFLLIDSLSQFFYRSVYSFRQLIVSGDFDLVLIKPTNALFRTLLSGADLLDLILLPPIVIMNIYLGSLLNPDFINIIYYIIMVINGMLIATAFHIVVAAMTIITLEVDQAMTIYRDLTSMARLPVDIYKEPVKGLLTFILPVGIMMTIPAKGLLGLVHPMGVISVVIFGVALLIISLKFWQFALKRYTSASS